MNNAQPTAEGQRERILAKVRNVPSMPTVVWQVRRMLEEPDVYFGHLARAIEHDPGVTANILRLANSAYFGFRTQAGSVRQAIVRLGTERMFQLVVSLSVAPVARRPVRGYALPPGELWRHAVGVAVATERLGQALHINVPDYAFTAGLLHDLGKIVLGTFVQVDAAPIKEVAFEKGLSFDLAEAQVLGIDHTEVGAALLEQWRLPEHLVNATRWHHSPNDCQGDKLVPDLVHLADALCLQAGIGAGSDGFHYHLCPQSASRVGLNDAVSEAVVCQIVQGLEDLDDLFEGTKGRR